MKNKWMNECLPPSPASYNNPLLPTQTTPPYSSHDYNVCYSVTSFTPITLFSQGWKIFSPPSCTQVYAVAPFSQSLAKGNDRDGLEVLWIFCAVEHSKPTFWYSMVVSRASRARWQCSELQQQRRHACATNGWELIRGMYPTNREILRGCHLFASLKDDEEKTANSVDILGSEQWQ